MRRSKLKAFPSNVEGNVAIILAAALPIIVGTIGGGVDLARASQMRTALSQAIDSASAQISAAGIDCTQAGNLSTVDISDCAVLGGERVAQMANRLIRAEFQATGFSTKLDIDPKVSVNPASRRVILRATASYNCTLFKLLSPTCDISVGAASNDAAASKIGAKRLSLNIPPRAEIWLGEFGSPGLPTVISASGGAQPYKYAIGPNLPEGLRLDEKSGRISGKPASVSCERDCPPQMRNISVSASDATSPGRLEASGVIAYQVIFPLMLTLEPPQQGKSAFPQVTRTGGKPPFQFHCVAADSAVHCDPSTGRIMQISSPASEITISVIDARGKMASVKTSTPR